MVELKKLINQMDDNICFVGCCNNDIVVKHYTLALFPQSGVHSKHRSSLTLVLPTMTNRTSGAPSEVLTVVSPSKVTKYYTYTVLHFYLTAQNSNFVILKSIFLDNNYCIINIIFRSNARGII
jgi:hypothetical protein